MKDKTSFWLNLFLSAILPYLLGSGGIYLLVQFRERLPSWLYTTFLFVIYAVLIAVVIRFAFGDWLEKLATRLDNVRRHRAKRKLGLNLFDKWMSLSQLISEVLDGSSQLTKEHQDKYFKLRLWFICNRSTFLPLWHNFGSRRTDTAHDSSYYISIRDLGYEVLKENYGDPFSYFYEPPALQDLCQILKSEPADEV